MLPHLAAELQNLDSNGDGFVEAAEFFSLMAGESTLLQRAIANNLAITNFHEFVEDVTRIFDEVAGMMEIHTHTHTHTLAVTETIEAPSKEHF